MNYRSFAVTSTGSDHLKQGKGCEDASLNTTFRSSVLKKWFAELVVVADGHGSDDYFRSARGAKIAALCAKEAIKEFYVSISKNRLSPRSELPFLVKHIIAQWHKEVDADIQKNVVTETELEKVSEKYRQWYKNGEKLHHAYGTTLIASAVTETYWFGIHIGDGRLTALYQDGAFDQPVPWDDKCFLNQTTSICDDDAAERARFYVSFRKERPLPAAVFLCSDGIDDNYPVEKNEEHLYKLYRTIALTFAEEGFGSTCEQLEDLAGNFVTKGKGDDTSIALIIDMDAVKAAAPVWKEQIKAEKARTAAIETGEIT